MNLNLQNYITALINEYLLHHYLVRIRSLNFLTLSTNLTGRFLETDNFLINVV